MSLIESAYNIPVTESAPLRVEQYCGFFEEVLGLTREADSSGNPTFWFGANKTVGFKIYGGSNIRILAISGKETYISRSDSNTGYSSATNIYYQISKNGDVIAWREGTTTFRYVAAKDEAGNWYIFQGNYMLHKDGISVVQNEAQASSVGMFTAVKMPTIVSEKMFTELYKMLSATSFIESNTIVSFDGKPYKVCSVSTSTSSIYPCFAFPIE